MTIKLITGSNRIASAATIALGFLAATVIILITGRNPAGMYQALLQTVSGFNLRSGTWNVRYAGEWLVISVPLVLCALSMGFAARCGVFNIGAEGQYIAGLTAAQIAAVCFPSVPVFHCVVSICAAIIAGAVWGGIAGFLKVRYKISEIVATIMMNYIALYIHRLVTMNLPGSSTLRTADFPATAVLSNQVFASLTNGSRLNNSLWLVIAALLFYWVVMEKTTLGFSIQAAGFNKDAARCAGIRVDANIIIAMTVAGAFAGLAGASVSLGVFPHGRVLEGFDNYGFDGIAVALGGNCKTAGIVVVGLLFGMLKSAQPLMQSHHIPREITSIIMGLVVVFISLRAAARQFIEWRHAQREQQHLFSADSGSGL